MSPEISERAFEEAIECALLQHGPDACPGDARAVRESRRPVAAIRRQAAICNGAGRTTTVACVSARTT